MTLNGWPEYVKRAGCTSLGYSYIKVIRYKAAQIIAGRRIAKLAADLAGAVGAIGEIIGRRIHTNRVGTILISTGEI